MNVLVDTSVWSLALRRKSRDLNAQERRVVSELAEIIKEGRARLVGLVRQELLSGISKKEQYESLRVRLRSFPDEPTDTIDYEEAARAGNQCRQAGIATSTVDILLCAVAIRRGWPIFTTDRDFDAYGRVLPVKFHRQRPVAPR